MTFNELLDNVMLKDVLGNPNSLIHVNIDDMVTFEVSNDEDMK